MDDREFEPGFAENEAQYEGAPVPIEDTPTPTAETNDAAESVPEAVLPGQPVSAFVAPDVPKPSQTVVCPRCNNTVPNENFCPVCAFNLKAPIQQPTPAPAAPPPAPPVAAPMQHSGFVAGGYPYPQAVQGGYSPPGGYPPPMGGNAYPTGAGYPTQGAFSQNTQLQNAYSQNPYPPLMPPYAAPPPSQPHPSPKASSSGWMLGILIALSAVTLLISLVTMLFVFIALAEPDSSSPYDYYNDGYEDPYGGNESYLPDQVLPQYFIGDTVETNGISYDFEYCDTGEALGDYYVVVGVTITNTSDNSYTLTPDLFRLEDANGEQCEYYGTGSAANDPLDRKVLMPGEKTRNSLSYGITAPAGYDYLPLYVLNTSGEEQFYVYLSLYE